MSSKGILAAWGLRGYIVKEGLPACPFPPVVDNRLLSARPREAVGVAAAVAVSAAAAPAAPLREALRSPPMREVAAGVGVSSIVHNTTQQALTTQQRVQARRVLPPWPGAGGWTRTARWDVTTSVATKVVKGTKRMQGTLSSSKQKQNTENRKVLRQPKALF